MSTVPPPPAGRASTSRLAPHDVYAFFLRRVGALIIDYVILVAALGVLALVMSRSLAGNGTYYLVALGLFWLYFAGMESSGRQATVGKMACGIKVCSMEGARIGFGRATGRHFAKILSSLILYIGFLMAAFTSKRQALHDLVAGTLVVRAAADEADVRNAVPPMDGAVAAIVGIVVVFAGIFLFGVLGAIAIPAYQDYAIRAQTVEGINAANAFKTPVGIALSGGRDPATVSSRSLQLSTPAGLRYVESIEVDAGAIRVTFGGQANPVLQQQSLMIVPALSDDNTLAWACGYAPVPAGHRPVLANYAQYTDVPKKYLPTACRG